MQSLGATVNKQTPDSVLAQGSPSMLRASVDTIICQGQTIGLSPDSTTNAANTIRGRKDIEEIR